MRSVNSITLLGNVGNDPEIRVTKNGAKVATISLATSREWKDASGQKQDKTEWHRLIVWGTAKSDGLAGVVEQYVRKGSKLYATGRVEYREYEKDGAKRYVTEVNVTDLVLLGDKGERKTDTREPDTFADDDDAASLPF